MKTKVAIVGSGNIGTDLMIKVMEMSATLEMGALVGIDADSDGLARARKLGVATTHEGLEGLTTGDRLTVTLGGLTLGGDVQYVRYPRNLAGTLEELNDGLLCVEMEPSGG